MARTNGGTKFPNAAKGPRNSPAEVACFEPLFDALATEHGASAPSPMVGLSRLLSTTFNGLGRASLVSAGTVPKNVARSQPVTAALELLDAC